VSTPRRPLWSALAALAGCWMAGVAAAVVVGIVLSAGGVRGTPGGAELAIVVLWAAGSLSVVAALARRGSHSELADLGIRTVPARVWAEVTGFGILVVTASWAILEALSGVLGELPAPRELSTQSPLDRAAGLPDTTHVGLGLETLASLLARGVLLVLVTEIVLRGFVLPVLARRLGRGWAIAIVVLAGTFVGSVVAETPGLVLPAAALGLVLCLLRLETGSILPGLGLSGAAAGAVLGMSLDWSPLAVSAAAIGCALGAAGPAFLVARLAGVERAPATGGMGLLRLSEQRGGASIEWPALLLIGAMCIGALFALHVPTKVGDWVETALCRIGGGDCTNTAGIDKNCIVASSTSIGSAAINVAVVKVGEDSTLIKQEYADGRVVFTLVKSGTVAAELIAGAKAKGGSIGFDATASVSAGGKLEGAMTFTFTDPEKAKEFEDQVRSAGSFGQVLRDQVEGFDPFGAKDWVLDHTIGKDVDPEDLPEPDSTYISVEALVEGKAGVNANALIANAGISGLIRRSGGARVYTSGPKKGQVELNMKITAEAAASLGLYTFGPGVNGKAEFTATVTLDPAHDYAPTKLKLVGTAGYTGDDLDFHLAPTTGQLSELSDKIKGAATGATSGTGHQVEFQAELDLNDPAAQAEAVAFLAPEVAGGSTTADLVRRIDQDGRLTFSTYDTTASKTEAGVLVGLGINVGAEGSQSNESRQIGGAWVREPGGNWVQRNCGPNGPQ
jgi:membrane protease YdiL (CAAX protease family)